MGQLDIRIKDAITAQDAELAEAITQLSTNPGQLTTFLQEQQAKVYGNIIQQKDNTFKKVYGDLQRASNVQEYGLMYNERNKQLVTLQEKIINNQKELADNSLSDANTASRKQEMNDWVVNNKKETLFIFSSGFILLSVLLLLTGLYRMGVISMALWSGLGVPLIIVFIIIVMYRQQYTLNKRDLHHWNKRKFEKEAGKIVIPICPTAEQVETITNAPTNLFNSSNDMYNRFKNSL